MKILHLIGSMDPMTGGPCEGIRNSIPILESYGIFREVVCLDDPQSSFIGMDSFPIHALGPGKTNWCYSKKLLPWLLENLQRFDTVIVNGLWLYHGYAVKEAFRLLRKQLVDRNIKTNLPRLFIMPHGMLDPYFQKAAHRKLKAIRNWFYWKMIESKLVNRAEGLLFTSETELKLAKESFQPYHPKQELNVGYGILTPPIFTPEKEKAFFDKCPGVFETPYLLFISRIHDKKGVDLLIQAYQAIISQEPDRIKQFPKLVIAGPGMETPYGNSLKNLIQPMFADSILFPGMLTGDAKWGAFYGCEAFILPSHQENFGIAVAEALACGKPVLISNQVNIWNEIYEGAAGIIGADTLEGTSEVLTLWFNKSVDEKKKMGHNAFETFQKYFSVDQAGRQFVDAIVSENYLSS